MNPTVVRYSAATLAALAMTMNFACAENEVHSSLAGMYYLNDAQGPMRAVDPTPPKGDVSNQILAGPSNGLASAYIIYERIAAGVKPKDLYTLPVDHTYLVLSGKLSVQLGSAQFVAEPETLVLVPAGVPHRVWNAGADPEADFQVMAPAPSRDLASMMKVAAAHAIDNPAQYIRVAPKLEKLIGGTGHDSLNERVLASRATGSEHVLERLNDVPPGGGRTEAHIHPFDQLYFVREGSLTFQYGMNTYDVGANTLVVLPAGIVHSNANKGTTVERLITLLISEPPKGSPMGAGVTLESQRADSRPQ